METPASVFDRRAFLKSTGLLATHTLVAATGLELFISSARGDQVSLASLAAIMPAADGLVLAPSDARFAKYQTAFNKRTLKVPMARILCATANGVAIAIGWAQKNAVPLAMRSGGHSFEGLSQTTGLALDTRPMNKVTLAKDLASFTAGAGCLLGDVYTALAAHGRMMPAGSCPSVGITGHTLGGGYGLSSRMYGLAADNLLSVQIVTADGKTLICSETQNPDLFWALRGGGAGSFGVVTQLTFKTHQVKDVCVFSMRWTTDGKTAGHLMSAWQAWAPSAPREITSLMGLRKSGPLYSVRVVGQSFGNEAAVQSELARFNQIAVGALKSKTCSFIDSVHHFGGNFAPTSTYMKGKSDYLAQPMPAQALFDFLTGIPVGVDVVFDSYGGAISDLKNSETAFAHREGYISSLQYYTEWQNASQTPQKLADMRAFHTAMRPHMSGSAYFNYCDLDIANYAQAYWGENLQQLVAVKKKYDPQNIFKHAQSIPLQA